MADPASIAALLQPANADAVVCCAASAPLTELSDDAFVPSLHQKLLGQVEVVRHAMAHIRDDGSITLTSGKIQLQLLLPTTGLIVTAGNEPYRHRRTFQALSLRAQGPPRR